MQDALLANVSELFIMVVDIMWKLITRHVLLLEYLNLESKNRPLYTQTLA